MESTPAPVLTIEQGRATTRVSADRGAAAPATIDAGTRPGDDSPLARAIQQAGGMMVSGADGVTDIIMPPFAAETTKVKPEAVAAAPKSAEGKGEPSSSPVPPDCVGRALATNTPMRIHAVKRGETLFEIADRYYGTGHMWRTLAKYNGIEDKDGVVRTGDQLKIPGREVLTGKPAMAEAKQEPKPESAPKKPEKRREAAPVRPQKTEYASYTVKRGDTLGDISMKTLGTSRRWKEIVDLNRIKDADHIPAGTVLKIPVMRG
jgi:nucleoid-associated protein YgaU